MRWPGLIGGRVGYYILCGLGRFADARGYLNSSAYATRSKLEILFGPQIWTEVKGKIVIDFGCGLGREAIEVAQHEATRVIGVEIRENVLRLARAAAEKANVSDRCRFVTKADETADLILSVDGFEHYADPAGVLREIRRLIRNDGRIFVSFGPPWFHPQGGHIFSVFPWAHLIFTEPALLRWRSDIKSDGATRFGEVEGGLNQMTVRRFERLVARSDFRIVNFEAVPIRRFRRLHHRLTREFLTSVVRCTLTPRTERVRAVPPAPASQLGGSVAAGRAR